MPLDERPSLEVTQPRNRSDLTACLEQSERQVVSPGMAMPLGWVPSMLQQASGSVCPRLPSKRHCDRVELPNSAEVVIVGGGIVGISTAYYLARRGCTDVVVLEAARTLGGRTTQRCGGGIRFQFSSRTNIELSLLSSHLRSQLAAEIGKEFIFHRTGYLFVTTTDVEAQDLRASVVVQRETGINSQWLEPGDLARMLPMMNLSDTTGASWHPGDGWIDPKLVIAAQLSLAEGMGVRCLPSTQVIGIRTLAGRLQRVQTNRGDVVAQVVINAAGPWAPTVCRMVGYVLPLSPFVHQVCVTSPIKQFPPGMPTVIFTREGIGFRHRGENVVIGCTRTRPYNGRRPPQVDRAFEKQIWCLAAERLPFFNPITVLSRFACLYEITSDGHAILGPVPGCAGLFCAAGFNGHGFMHALAIGYVLSQLVLDGRTDALDVRPLLADRFSNSCRSVTSGQSGGCNAE